MRSEWRETSLRPAIGGKADPFRYNAYFATFQSIFRLPPSIPMYYVPGNHDLPLRSSRLFSPHARERYLKHFSPPNSILPIANHSLVLLDAVGLVEEDYRRYAAEMQFGEWDGVEGGVIEFVKTVGEGESTRLVTTRYKRDGADGRTYEWAAYIDHAYTASAEGVRTVWSAARGGQDIQGCWTGVSELARKRDEQVSVGSAETDRGVQVSGPAAAQPMKM